MQKISYKTPRLSSFEERKLKFFTVSFFIYIYIIDLESGIKISCIQQSFARHHVRLKRKSKPRFRSINASHGCTVSFLAYLESENRITSISSAASGPSASQERRRPCTLSSSPFVSRDRAHRVITPWRRGGSEGRECGLLRFIDLSPSTFTLPSHMPHPTPAFPRRRTFLPASCDAVGESIRGDAGKKQGTLCLLNAPQSKGPLVTPEEGHREPLLKLISRFECLQ